MNWFGSYSKTKQNLMIYRKTSEIKPNPNNPRIIKDDKFKKLVQSIKKLVVLGGNMRLKAANEVGLKELPVILADDWTEEQKSEFLIKDNVGFGEWNWDELQSDWDVVQLDNWGLDLPGFDLSPNDLGENFSLPDGDKAPFQQMTFTLADEQAAIIKNAIDDIKETDDYKYAETMGNENSNGNALYLIVASWAGQRK